MMIIAVPIGLRSTLPSCQLEAGQYYIVVDGYGGGTGN